MFESLANDIVRNWQMQSSNQMLFSQTSTARFVMESQDLFLNNNNQVDMTSVLTFGEKGVPKTVMESKA